MLISGLGASDNSNPVTNSVANSSVNSSLSGNSATGTTDDGISLDLQYVNSVLDGASALDQNSNAGYLFSNLNSSILTQGNLTNVQSEIDTYTQSLSSSNVYESTYTTPSASFLADLNSLKSDAATGNLSAAQSDLAKAKLAGPDNVRDAVWDATWSGDLAGEASAIQEGTDNVAEYLQTQGYSAVDAKAEANAITFAYTPSLGLGGSTAGEPSSDPIVTGQITSLATSAATLDSSTTGGTSDPLFNILESLLKADAISSAASLQTLSLLNSLYGAGGATAATAASQASSEAPVSSYA